MNELNVSCTDIGDEGMKSLVENGVLITFDVGHNKIGDYGENTLIRNTWTKLKTNGNPITKILSKEIDSQIKRNLEVSERKMALPMGFFQNINSSDKKNSHFNFSFN